jgi:hypothetical protein
MSDTAHERLPEGEEDRGLMHGPGATSSDAGRRCRWMTCAGLVALSLIVVFVALAFTVWSPRPSPPTCLLHPDTPLYRLPQTVIPHDYHLLFQPDFNNLTFNGTIVVTVDVVAPTTCIVMHAYNMTVWGVSFAYPSNGPVVRPTTIVYSPSMAQQWVTFQFAEPFDIVAGATLTVSFQGLIRGTPQAAGYGFYISPADFLPAAVNSATAAPALTAAQRRRAERMAAGDHVSDLHEQLSSSPASTLAQQWPEGLRVPYAGDGVDRTASRDYIYATHFEPTDARTAFPCFDEPQLKARFRATLLAPADMQVFFNTAESADPDPAFLSVVVPNGWKAVAFQSTPHAMSSYLVAFAFGYFDVVPVAGPNGLPIRIITPVGRAAWAALAVNVSAAAVSFFERSFNYPYPWGKLDLITVTNNRYGCARARW